jgi:hypothetical protein
MLSIYKSFFVETRLTVVELIKVKNSHEILALVCKLDTSTALRGPSVLYHTQ